MKIYQYLSQAVGVFHNNKKTFIEYYEEMLNKIVFSGGGFARDYHLCLAESNPEKLIFTLSYHHMHNGYYIEYSYHTITVTPSLQIDFELSIESDYSAFEGYNEEVKRVNLELGVSEEEIDENCEYWYDENSDDYILDTFGAFLCESIENYRR